MKKHLLVMLLCICYASCYWLHIPEDPNYDIVAFQENEKRSPAYKCGEFYRLCRKGRRTRACCPGLICKDYMRDRAYCLNP